jgi:WD40 repeat protein
MTPFVRFVTAVLACLICALEAPSQNPADALGDPLPEGAIARLGTTRMRHFSSPDHYCWGISCLAWSPDGKLIATTSYADKIGIEARLWEAATGKPRSVLENNLRYGPRLLRFAPDGKTIAAAARDKIVLWNTATGKEMGQLVGHQGDVDSLVFQDGGKTIVSVSRDGAVHWWDVADRKTIRQWDLLADDPRKTAKGDPILSRGIRDACFSADGKTLAFSKWWKTQPDDVYSNNMAIVVDLGARKELWRKDIQVYDCQFAFTPDGKRVVLSWAASFSLHETATGRPLTELHHHLAWGMDFSPDGKTLALCLSGEIAFWSPDEKTPLRKVESPLHGGGYNTFASRPAFSPDGKKLAIDRRRRFQVLDVVKGKPTVSWPSYDEGFTSLGFSANGRKLFADDLTIDTATWRQREAPEDPWKRFDGLQTVSMDGTICIAADGKHKDAVFDVKSGRVLARLKAPARDPGLHGGFFSPNSSHYVMQDRSCDGKEVDTVFAIPKGKRLWQLSCDRHVGTCCWTFSTDESRVAFLETSTGMIHVRDTATGELLRQLGNYRGSVALALSLKGNMLAVWEPGRRSVEIWDLRTGKNNRSLALEQEAKAGDHACLQWSADSRMLAVGGLDNSVRLWEVASGQVRHEFCGHLARASCLAFSPDGKLIASGSDDTTLLIWKTFPDK